jgi:eukaryotic-like serine/threonine-protein kinase
MENPPSIHPRDDEFLDGSTVQRAPAYDAASIGSTASVVPPAGRVASEPPGFSAQEVQDDAKTVIRRTGSDSGVIASAVNSHASTPAAVASVLLGTRLNHFLLEELIGGGGMGAVFRARDDRLDRIVAIKVIPYVGEDQDLQRRFRNEAQNAARLDHPYIARVFDVGQYEQWHYIVFEHVEGINLRDMVARDGVLPIDDAVYYTRQIAEAIEHANSRGIVHRDIKPSNVLVGIDGNVKVVDMGLARSQQIEMSGDMTASGVTLGTFDYISPEQARDPRDADVRSDIYSLGCTLYYLLTASPPYPGGTMLQKLLSHGNAPPPDPRGLRPEVSDNLTAIIHKMLAKNPADRYPRAIDVVADLRELAIREGLVRAQSRGTLTIAPSDPIPQFLSRHLPWIIAAAMVLAIGAWLQLSSAVGRNEFTLDIPPSAQAPRELTAVTSPNLLERTPQESPSGNEVVATSKSPSELASESTTGATPPASQDAATVPPQFSEFAMRTETPKVTAADAEPPAVSPAPVKRIVIGPASNDPGVRLTNTLAEALQLAEEFKVDVIEIAVPSLTTPPIQINRDGLTIRSIVGASEIQFVSGEAASMQRIAMVDVGSHNVELQDLHLTWKVRSTTIEGGCLFSIATSNRLVKLANCSITIENLAERDEVFAFEIAKIAGTPATSPTVASSATVAPPIAGAAAGDAGVGMPTTPSAQAPEKSNPPPLVAIELRDVAIRGEMTMINLVDAVQLEINWQNGLLAVSRRMLEATGANVRPALGSNQIQISLELVTAWTQDGFARMRLGPSGAYPLMIDRSSRRSVFHHAPTANHFEITGLESAVADPSLIVQLRGEDNAYDFDLVRDSSLLLLSQWNEPPLVYRLADVLSPANPTWMLDRSPQWVVRWTAPVPAITPSRLTVEDFSQYGTLIPGFEKNRLPAFPKLSPTEPEI